MLRCYGIRGATTVAENTREAILEATRELLRLIVARNEIAVEDVSSAFFTLTEDLDAEHPAMAARQIGWEQVALLCAREIPVPGSLGRCIRVLVHVNTEKSQADMRHVYLRDAVRLRPGFADGLAAPEQAMELTAQGGGR
ncbi:MAG TPA: chorismate mutase [Ktedonobacterales bacterium]|jgi:chorismate mutase|nr:chorismate mutase [Ktedonobacterales bacterium]